MVDAKRLSPTKETIRELFGKCGNQCAFKDCKHEIIDADGTFVAEICHIEAAETNGPRFNPDQTNEQRRHVSNLMLMCHKHHKITDNIDEFPTPSLHAMKKKHEAKYLDAANKIWASIEDHTDSDEVSLPVTLKRFYKLNCIEREVRSGVREAIHRLAKMLKHLPVPSREMLYHSVRRSSESPCTSGLQVIAEEMAQACNMRVQDVWAIARIMEKHKLVYVDDEYHGVYFLSHVGDVDEFDIWPALVYFCEETGAPLRDLLVDLRFSLLD